MFSLSQKMQKRNYVLGKTSLPAELKNFWASLGKMRTLRSALLSLGFYKPSNTFSVDGEISLLPLHVFLHGMRIVLVCVRFPVHNLSGMAPQVIKPHLDSLYISANRAFWGKTLGGKGILAYVSGVRGRCDSNWACMGQKGGKKWQTIWVFNVVNVHVYEYGLGGQCVYAEIGSNLYWRLCDLHRGGKEWRYKKKEVTDTGQAEERG